MRKPTIILVSQSGTANEYLDQSARYRIYNPGKAFARLGYNVTVTRDKFDDDFPMYGDVYLFHRPMFSESFLSVVERLSVRGAKLVCDFDDLNFDPSTITQNAFFRIRDKEKISNQAAALFEGASFFDTVITSSQTLTANARRILGSGAQFHTIGMGVDDDLFHHVMANKDHYLNSKGRQAIGYFAGSNTHAIDFPMVEAGVLRFINSHAKARFLLMGQIEPEAQLRAHSNFIHLPRMPYEQLFEHAALCKVIIAPLEDNEFNKVKASTKLLENSLVMAYTCASPTPEFDNLDLEYESVSSERDWERVISMDYIRSIGSDVVKKNHEILSQKYLMSKIIENYIEVLGL